MKKLRLALAQINTTVGDLSGNSRKILDCVRRAERLGADLVSFPELALPGYPPEDLLLQPDFISANLRALDALVRQTAKLNLTAVVGFVDREDDIYNAAAVFRGGKIYGRYHKMFLPNYGVFDEFRYFRPGRESSVYRLNGVKVGISICEDIWYPDGPTLDQVSLGGAQVILNISSSPYHAGKMEQRHRMLATRASDNAVIIAYNNLVGGQDELVFDGGSMIVNQEGEAIALGRLFEEDLLVADLDIDAVFRQRLRDPRNRQERRPACCGAAEVPLISLPPSRSGRSKPTLKLPSAPAFDPEAEVYQALTVGTRDYVFKNGFGSTVLGLSGGIDSALTACVAVDALGRDRVIGVGMPSRFTSEISRRDSRQLAENLGIRFLEFSIDPVLAAYVMLLAPAFKGMPEDVTEENLQARIRGNLLMALSNKFGSLVLTTGNKSEMSVGYCTLYGDMAGGFAVLKDVPKTKVRKLAAWRNRRDERIVIPETTITRPPTAELRADQFDTDSLPEYDILDPILYAYVEEGTGLEDIVNQGFPKPLVRRVLRMVDANEYKRRQGSPGIKITPRAFGRDRRMPITNKFK